MSEMWKRRGVSLGVKHFRGTCRYKTRKNGRAFQMCKVFILVEQELIGAYFVSLYSNGVTLTRRRLYRMLRLLENDIRSPVPVFIGEKG